ncbi:glutamine-hydrolyzing GMP synthase [Borrelia miyamotoi]|uniref:GMP synthase [glutamine-hydrolyzing] n=1 Tax=Borrelia miyamotoi TaxID=47466 RepID=A0AAQ2WWL1_9SPIR|nr:glutamine-hydrolyzing GMP synthase [Borrelia miyamotoi]AJA67230.1 GMP synthase [Borrelia miyamotoi LB-2001]QTL84133.1 glutamine-hydrolyzing GMP synthase [Borrelia miyamotoi]WAZ85782.1 glutamine-hydrolyzing GMP synthase [Borrelia miyamotoi]WAZ91564.1 glutamine-hydrolyzing GMP synthase [Borrelia miyamotoi]WAZ92852.1 glutamine-hydrolyzing GMP synthase [Borrelia miyamotoi]
MDNGAMIILDFGSQYSQLIAKKIRDMGVYTKVISYSISAKEIEDLCPVGIILSGGPASVYLEGSPTVDIGIFNLDIPILGICYGMQLIIKLFGGVISKCDKQEFGSTELFIEDNQSYLFSGISNKLEVMMSHGDSVEKIPNNFNRIAYTKTCVASVFNKNQKIYGLQFHPEVTYSEAGTQILRNFVFKICQAQINWSLNNSIDDFVDKIKLQVGDKKVILGLSGGTDSLVCSLLVNKAIKSNLICVFIDTGLLRKNEVSDVLKLNKQYNLNIKYVDSSSVFLNNLKNIEEPEEKRKIIGKTFIEIFEKVALEEKDIDFLAQGTIYSDVIESESGSNVSLSNIKSHHNVGGLPEKIELKLLEPLRELFKDEVIELGIQLGIEENILYKHPFPGPGLAIRVIGKVTQDKISILQEADSILIEELLANNLYYKMRQAFVVLLPIQSVGVMGDNRTYEYTAVIRCVNTLDFMTASWVELSYDFLKKVSSRIINEVRGINRVCYDISSKPPATIEWE